MRGCVEARFSKPLHSSVGCVKVARAEEGIARHATFFHFFSPKVCPGVNGSFVKYF